MFPAESMIASSPRSCTILPTTMTLRPTYESRYCAVMRGVEVASAIAVFWLYVVRVGFGCVEETLFRAGKRKTGRLTLGMRVGVEVLV